MKCKFCGKKISFANWLFCKRSCVDHWMNYYELPSLDRFLAQPKNKVKFEKYKIKKKEQEMKI